MQFFKYHALGNDYLVLDPKNYPELPSTEEIEKICNRHYGLGSDGLLYGPLPSETAQFRLQIFNPDGSEAEKSGNGLRIFARYLWNQDLVDEALFTVETKGGVVECTINDYDKKIIVAMGKANFQNDAIPPVTGASREVLKETLQLKDKAYTFYAVSMGNPHCVLPLESISKELVCEIGPQIELNKLFPNRTNVQLMEVLDRNTIRIEIWERGAGYTLASGSSSCAAASVAYKMGLCDSNIDVHMPGGVIQICIDEEFNVQMSGPVTRVGTFELHPEVLGQALPELSH